MASDDSNFCIIHKTKGRLPSLPFVQMKDAILGADYELSLVSIGSVASRKLNRTYRSIDKATDILSFPLDKTSGEIFINLKEAEKERHAFGRNLENFIGFLFIHGLVHLKGYEHGSRMEELEATFRKQFGI